MSLEDFPHNRAHNERLHDIYRSGLEALPGLSIVVPANTVRSNFQYAVLEVDQASYGLSRDLLLRALHRENVIGRRYFYPGVHRVPPYLSGDAVDLPVTDALCARLLQLPLGALVTEESAERIVGLLVRLGENSSAVEAALLAEGR
jgi:dTDP-4-amino-4,6-dideoxygalactose transaminase